MIRQISNKAKKHFVAFLPLYTLLQLPVCMIINFTQWHTLIIAEIGVFFLIILCDSFCLWKYSRELAYSKEARQWISLFRELLEQAFVYNENRDMFYDKFLEIISAESLDRRGIIDPNSLICMPKYNRSYTQIKYKDAVFLELIRIGFSNRELAVIYNFGSINSVYMKRYRLKRRLDNRMREILDDCAITYPYRF